MLFTDGTILTIQELREHDNFVLDVASTESIELSSKLVVAQREIGYELRSFLVTRSGSDDLSRVVVDQALRDLIAIHALSIVYRDAYNSHLNDRYLGRWKEFAAASGRDLLRFLRNGVGIAAVPVPQPSNPDVTASPNGGLAPGAYWVQIVWRHLTGAIGERSAPVLIDCPGGSVVVHPGRLPNNITAWHVFIGGQDSVPSRQNVEPLTADAIWTQGAALRTDLSGPETSGPDYFVRNSGQISRG